MSDILIRTACHPIASGKAIKIAVTGGIGVGKSTVSRILEELGAIRIDADNIAHQVLRSSANQIAEVFGQPDWKKGVDRKKLAEIVFQNPEARKKLEQIVHPAVQAKAEEQFAALDNGEIGVYDVPLLETKQCQVEKSQVKEKQNGKQNEKQYDLIIVVTAPLKERYRRLANRSGMTHTQVDQRIAAQITDEERIKNADVVIKNTGSEIELKYLIEKSLWPVITALKKSEK